MSDIHYNDYFICDPTKTTKWELSDINNPNRWSDNFNNITESKDKENE